MSIWLEGSKRKPTGGKYHHAMPKKKMHLGRTPALTRVGEPRVRKVRTLGGNQKLRALRLNTANVYNPKTKKVIKATIEDVMLNPANRHYVRMDVITKGAVLKTDKGYVKVTNRPGQEGIVNAVFTEYSEEKKKARTAAKTEKKVKKHVDRKIKVEKKK